MTSRRLRGAVIAGLCVAILTAVGVAGATAAEPAVTYERTAYDGTIWEVTADDARPLTYPEWSELGFPSFIAADTLYWRVSLFPTVYATTWFGDAGHEFVADLTYPEFVAAGRPRPEVVPWAEGIEAHKWQSSSELFATDPTGYVVKLTFDQWRRADYPSYTTRSNRGFVSMTWDSSGAIAYMCDLARGLGGKLTYDEWASLGYPTPYRTGRVANDWIFSYPGSSWVASTLVYRGPVTVEYSRGASLYRPLTYAEWQQIGAPQPNSRAGWTPQMPDPSCGAGSASPMD